MPQSFGLSSLFGPFSLFGLSGLFSEFAEFIGLLGQLMQLGKMLKARKEWQKNHVGLIFLVIPAQARIHIAIATPLRCKALWAALTRRPQYFPSSRSSRLKRSGRFIYDGHW